MNDSETAPRQWWVAVLLAIFGFGAAGYLYVGRPRRAIVAAVVFLVLGIALATGLGGVLVRPIPLLLTVALQLVAGLFFTVDSARIALREGQFRLRPYNQYWVYGAVVAVSVVLSLFVLKPPVQSFEIFSASMAPTLIEGDRILVNTSASARVPTRGTLVAMALPSDPSVAYIRRVIGVPGDRVQMLNGVLQLNGAPVTLTKTDMQGPSEEGTTYRETLPGGATYLIFDKQPDGISDNTGVFEIPDGLYFVLGDNRDNAQDSRMREVGGVPTDYIIGAVTGIFWSPDRSRIGMTPE